MLDLRDIMKNPFQKMKHLYPHENLKSGIMWEGSICFVDKSPRLNRNGTD
jgi:hypothetical protein